ncbi:hypothetical protein [Solilutibacter pythonis]|uniref:hypothetical protein n=1 Tax=Solilutibacter pythonis TaxID=2483112 RepID=UPI0011C464B1|nr:hypothetical protein [Lysobacter pythonis]
MFRNIFPPLLALSMVSCSQYESPPQASDKYQEEELDKLNAPAVIEQAPAKLDARVELPDGWDYSRISPGECITHIDQINGVPAKSMPYARSSDITIVGWNVTSSKSDATPEVIYGVFKPYDQSSSGALLKAERKPRPDVAGDNRLYANAGYEALGKFPADPGRYRYYIWTGTPDAIVECDSKVIIVVN